MNVTGLSSCVTAALSIVLKYHFFVGEGSQLARTSEFVVNFFNVSKAACWDPDYIHETSFLVRFWREYMIGVRFGIILPFINGHAQISGGGGSQYFRDCHVSDSSEFAGLTTMPFLIMRCLVTVVAFKTLLNPSVRHLSSSALSYSSWLLPNTSISSALMTTSLSSWNCSNFLFWNSPLISSVQMVSAASGNVQNKF